ncbi:MAG: GNAT family N-acetyltransferase [Actinobacteria bacterium]|nr:MAG: GNAT family N-acetyltransferase [Actinomycetota bacterium]
MAEYPSEYELDAVLRDGGVVRIRPIKPEDSDLIVRFFETLGPESRYFRFFKLKKSLDPEEVRYFTNVDYEDRMALIALHEDEMVGIASYDIEGDDSEDAEVAFAVADAHQGRGIGTKLLQLLTNRARSTGLNRFRAYVLPENRQMMRVFRNSGYELTRTIDEGVFTVDFPVTESEESLSVAAEHEKRAVAASLLPMFFPRSIAVIGASNNAASIGGKLFHNILSTGFTGPLYPVNPTSRVVNSVKAYTSITEVPDEIDLAYIVVPQRYVIDVTRECIDKGVRGIVVISAGFSEVGGEGAEDERKLLDMVRSSGMRMIGPNCMGLLNTASSVRLNGTFAPVYPPAGNVAMSSQSGALGIAILDYATRNNIGISQFVSVGNKADVSGNDLLLAWEDDPETDVITLYVESFGNPMRFSRLARRIGRRKPIIAVKSGRSAAGSRAASSHTGALASSDVAVDALFRQAGVIRVDTIEELFDAASLLANQPIPAGSRVGIVTNAGGPGILAADALEANGLELPELSEGLRQEIQSHLPPEASTRNPVDLIASGGPEQFEAATRLLLDSGEVDSVMVIYVPVSPEGARDVAAALRRCQDSYGGEATLLSVFMQAAEASSFLAGEEPHRTIPTYTFPEAAALALARAVRHGIWRQRDPGIEARLDDHAVEEVRAIVDGLVPDIPEEGVWLEPGDVDRLLQAAGLRIPRTATVDSADEAVATAESFGGPVVLKVISPSALHKSDVGGVVLDVQGEEEVREAYKSVTTAVDDPDGVLVQEFIEGGHEVLIGMTQDPNFGPLVVYGLGGVYVELLRDVAFRIHPLTDVDASEMVRDTKGYKLLEGYRNQPVGDVAALEESLLRVSGLISAAPELVEMDLNPVKVHEPGKGAVVVDARMRIRPLKPTERREMRDLPATEPIPQI